MKPITNVILPTNADVRNMGIRAGEATVLDLNTNIAYNIFWGGAPNTHTDFSPLTPEDTEIMRRISGGWNWNPRPVVLFIQEHQLAASVHHFPHGSIIGGNPGLPNASNVGPFNQPNGGHMCMFFRDSVNNGQPRPSPHAREMQLMASAAFVLAKKMISVEPDVPEVDEHEANTAYWAKEARLWAMAKGITDGTRPTDSITRQEVITMIYRFFNAVK